MEIAPFGKGSQMLPFFLVCMATQGSALIFTACWTWLVHVHDHRDVRTA